MTDQIDLSGVSIRRLVDELRKRFDEIDTLRAEVAQLLGTPVPVQPPRWNVKSPKGKIAMSRVKQAWWDERRAKAAALGVTLAEYLRQEKAKKAADTPIVETSTGRRMKD